VWGESLLVRNAQWSNKAAARLLSDTYEEGVCE
jgi:hypothetical protein